ncbi:MAG: winged helix-turn-helix domain-containing protein [Candidatus Micrarchaeia archaeon]|jgi:hypothetical protein
MVSVEKYFGENAGKLWHVLNTGGPQTIAQLKRKAGLKDNELYGALGWLGREGKLNIVGDVPLLFKFGLK